MRSELLFLGKLMRGILLVHHGSKWIIRIRKVFMTRNVVAEPPRNLEHLVRETRQYGFIHVVFPIAMKKACAFPEIVCHLPHLGTLLYFVRMINTNSIHPSLTVGSAL